MKQLTDTRFFFLLKKNGNDMSALEQEYDNFATLLLEKGNTSTDRMTHHNTLVYTRLKFSNLAEVSENK